MSDLGPKRFLYIVGTSYTGSTLLSFLLNLHPRIISIGEDLDGELYLIAIGQDPRQGGEVHEAVRLNPLGTVANW